MEESGYSSSFDDDNGDIEDFQLTKKQQIERFKQVTSQQDIDKSIDGAIPEKTKRQTSWAFSVYESWCTARSESSLLAEMSANDIEEQLCRFVMEC